MCDYCEKKIRELDGTEEFDSRGRPYGLICPKKAGQYMGKVLAKKIKGEPMDKDEKELLECFQSLTGPVFTGSSGN